MKRFYESNADDVDLLLEASTSNNTKKSTNNWIRQYDLWAKSRGFRSMETYQPADLNKVLELFYVELRKVDGEEYEPDSLKIMLAGLEQHLKEKNFPVSIIHGREFTSSKKVLQGKARKLREMGKGKQPNKACSFT